ncbi:MAG: type II toxin-antitoxin system HicB family antitoxin [Candidatus Promineifilaceae bacterium]
MTYDVLVTKEKSQRYTARVLLLPEIVASGNTEEEALEQVKTAITDLRINSRIVQLDVPSLADGDDPWLRYAGLWADDPDWELFRSEVEAFRQVMDS